MANSTLPAFRGGAGLIPGNPFGVARWRVEGGAGDNGTLLPDKHSPDQLHPANHKVSPSDLWLTEHENVSASWEGQVALISRTTQASGLEGRRPRLAGSAQAAACDRNTVWSPARRRSRQAKLA